MPVIPLRFQNTNFAVLLFGTSCHRWKIDICPPQFKEDQIFLFINFCCSALIATQSARPALSLRNKCIHKMNRGDHCLPRIDTPRDVWGTLGLPWWIVLERKLFLTWLEKLWNSYTFYHKGAHLLKGKTKLSSSLFSNVSQEGLLILIHSNPNIWGKLLNWCML